MSTRLDRRRVRFKPLSKRENKVLIERDCVRSEDDPGALPGDVLAVIKETAERMVAARHKGRPVILAFGAHTIKNGLGPVLIHLMEKGWLTHLATNGAGVIHDWEFAFQGASSEDVRSSIVRGEFGHWEETGFYLNLALVIGAYRGMGYGESVGRMIEEEALEVPRRDELVEAVQRGVEEKPVPERVAAASDLLAVIDRFDLSGGRMDIPHLFKQFSPQAAACRLGIPFTGHPMFGHDIIYNHPLNQGSAVGRAAERDYLTFAHAVSRMEDGVYLSVGSAVMSPMIFEKAFSMAQNLAHQEGQRIENHFIVVVDLAKSSWDWSQGEPPEGHPDYYLRFYKTFHRMGGELRYVSADNRDFILHLCRQLPA